MHVTGARSAPSLQRSWVMGGSIVLYVHTPYYMYGTHGAVPLGPRIHAFSSANNNPANSSNELVIANEKLLASRMVTRALVALRFLSSTLYVNEFKQTC